MLDFILNTIWWLCVFPSFRVVRSDTVPSRAPSCPPTKSTMLTWTPSTLVRRSASSPQCHAHLSYHHVTLSWICMSLPTSATRSVCTHATSTLQLAYEYANDIVVWLGSTHVPLIESDLTGQCTLGQRALIPKWKWKLLTTPCQYHQVKFVTLCLGQSQHSD